MNSAPAAIAAGARTVIAGGSGFVGQSLAKHLVKRGADVVVLGRGTARPVSFGRHVRWDARTIGAWLAELDGAAAIINLVGRTVDCTKTPAHCREILNSRVDATNALGAACRAVERPPPIWVQMSTAHIYGDPPTAVCDESSPTGGGLAPDVGRAWEAAFATAALPSQRGVVLRTSFVVGRPNPGGRGALGKLGLLARAGLGGAVGSGRQGMSWIHEDDMNAIFERAITNDSMRGMYVVSSPHPVSQRDFMRALRHAVRWPKVPLGLPAPAWLVRIGAPLVMRTDPELAILGRYVMPRRLLAEGYEFRWPEIGGALDSCCARQ